MIVASLGGLALGFAAVVADAHQGIEISQIECGKLWPFVLQQGRLRCEDAAGAVILSVGGKDYAVNGMASARYASIQPIYRQNSLQLSMSDPSSRAD